MGVISSITIMLFFTHYSSSTRKIPNYLSDVHYLQVRDDYSLYSVSSQQLKDSADQHDKRGRKRNSVEGMYEEISAQQWN